MRILLILIAMVALAASSQASACMASGPDGFTHGLIWEYPQSRIPADSVRLKVKYEGSSDVHWGFLTKVVDGPASMIGKTYRVIGEASHSCVGLGATEGFIVVRKAAVDTRNTNDGTIVKSLAAIEYEPSWLNELLRYFGASPWQYPGDQGPGRMQWDD